MNLDQVGNGSLLVIQQTRQTLKANNGLQNNTGEIIHGKISSTYLALQSYDYLEKIKFQSHLELFHTDFNLYICHHSNWMQKCRLFYFQLFLKSCLWFLLAFIFRMICSINISFPSMLFQKQLFTDLQSN